MDPLIQRVVRRFIAANPSPYRHWDRERRRRELGRLNDYVMDMDADGKRPPPQIERLLDLGRKLTEQEEDTLIAWSESNTPGHYA